MKGVLYGVGIGPGDPELITLKALKVIQSVDFIAIPDTGGENTALRIAEEYVKDKELIFCPMPMTRDSVSFEEAHRQSALKLEHILDSGKNVAFLTLGDPTIYSTYMYVHRLVAEDGYKTEIISGVPSFCAAAAALGISLCDGGEPLHIIPASYDDYERMLRYQGSKVLMKSGKSTASVKENLRLSGLMDNSYVVERCGMEGQRIYKNIAYVPDELSYFSLFIVKNEAIK